MAGQPAGVSWSDVNMPTLPELSTVCIFHPAAPTVEGVLTVAVEALPDLTVGGTVTAAFEALPAPAERGVTNAATDARTMVATMRVVIIRFALSISCITFFDA